MPATKTDLRPHATAEIRDVCERDRLLALNFKLAQDELRRFNESWPDLVGGLFKLAQQSEEAEIQQTKLENSIKNSDQAFKNNGKALTDLATGLQQVTAADGDAIVGAESLLVQFGLTEEQVKTVTPLVVDLSRKLGIGLDQAAKMVAKSIGGSSGALKKAGIQIDESRLKTDAFSATVDALAGSVGGFARQEGQTFAGQIATLKNNLGDVC